MTRRPQAWLAMAILLAVVGASCVLASARSTCGRSASACRAPVTAACRTELTLNRNLRSRSSAHVAVLLSRFGDTGSAGVPAHPRVQYRLATGRRYLSSSAVLLADAGALYATLTGLKPGQHYLYRFVADGCTASIGIGLGRFTTQPTGTATAPVEPTHAVPIPIRATTAGSSAPSLLPISSDTPAPVKSTIPEPSTDILWGAQIGTQFTGDAAPWDMNAVRAFTHLAGKAPSIVPFNLPFEGCATSCNFYAFPTKQMNAVRSNGQLTMLNWSSQSSPLTTAEPDFTLASLIDGTYDSYIRSFANAAKAWAHPFLLRFDWEMNGTWFPWAEAANGNSPGQFVKAWRHVYDIFAAAGATNVDWVWCPTADFNRQFTALSELYPGDAYVDATCIDGYNFGTLGTDTTWQSFNQIFLSTYATIQGIAPSKPVIIGEVGSTEHGGSKAAWIADMFDQLSAGTYPDLRALVWFDAASGDADWPLETSAAAVEAFANGISGSRFTSNTFGDL